MFWSSQAAKSRNCLFNFILGARGVGKTFCKKEDVINAYLKSGEEFVYMRRYKEELKEKNMERFFDDIEFSRNIASCKVFISINQLCSIKSVKA